MTAILPTDFIDSSNLRQIPDHQEVYLSPKTLTSIIFEVNEYVSPLKASQTRVDSAIMVPASGVDGTEGAISVNDRAAAFHHLHDLVDPKDSLNSVSAPKGVNMRSSSLHGLPAFVLRGRLSARGREQRASSVLPEEYEVDPSVSRTDTTIRLLVVRLEAQATDICVIVNVPWRELEPHDGVDGEEAFADSVLENVIASLDIKDFSLFGE